MSSDRAIILITYLEPEYANGVVIATDGPLRCDGGRLCALDWELSQFSDWLDDLPIEEDFWNHAKGLWLWTGEIVYCSCSSFCDCSPEWNTQSITKPTYEELKEFKII